MSLSQPRLQNPCKKFIEFKGDNGIFQYWDKEAKKNVQLKTPVSFIVLDELSTISGFSEAFQAGIYSNEVKSLQNQVLNVRCFKGNLSIIGKYAEIKDAIAKAKGKFCKSVYAALIHGDDLELVNFQLKGISFSSWLEKEVDLSLNAVTINRFTDGKKGKVEFKIPVYEALPIKRELMEKAVAMDKALQSFLSAYLSNNDQTFVQHHPEEEAQGHTYNDKAITPGSAHHRGEPAAFDGESLANKPDLENDDIPF